MPNTPAELWDHRADLAEQAIAERHSARLWGLPGTELGLIAWPPTSRDKIFFRWHYWWQAHYIDALVDASTRRPSRFRSQAIRRHLRAMKIRNGGQLTRNHYNDDKAWLALAMQRAQTLPKATTLRGYEDLVENLYTNIDPFTGLLPWREGENFYNVPTNGPVAILAARAGRLQLAERLLDWVFDNLINEDGLVMDGIRMQMNGPEVVPTTHSYCQGVILGACVELALAQRQAAGIAPDEVSEIGQKHITRAHGLIKAIRAHMTDRDGVISWKTSGGDGGLFNGILARYLALTYEKLRAPGRHTTEARALSRDMVLRTAEAVWRYRLEVDGLPVFSATWNADATMPQSGGLVGATIAGAVSSSDIAERDLSVQLSGWKLMEAAARITHIAVTEAGETGTASGA